MLQPGKARDIQRREINEAILQSATLEFAGHGYDGASLRTIASHAGVLQPQINYHFGSKLLLWQDVVNRLMAEIDVALADILRIPAGPRELLAQAIRAWVRFSASRPELVQILIHESTVATSRLEWLVETHVGPITDGLNVLWRDVADMPGAVWFPIEIAHHLLIGAAALPYVCGIESDLLVARRLRLGLNAAPSQEPRVRVERHADALIAAFLPAATETGVNLTQSA